MMKLLQEMKGIRHTLDEIVYYGFQQFIRSADSALHQQPTIQEMFRRQQSGASNGGAGGAHGSVPVMSSFRE